MNTRQLHYAYILSKSMNFSQTAEELGISQPALSKQIMALEADLGVKLFDRSKSPITLTPAGEFFVIQAEELLFHEDVLLKTLERFKNQENGRLIIGVSPFRCLYMMPPLVKAMKERFPGLNVVLSEYGRAQLHKGIAEGIYDLIITNLPVDEANLEAIPLEKDELVLAVPNGLLPLIEGWEKQKDTGHVDLKSLSRLPFVVVNRTQEMRQLFDTLFKQERVQPVIYAEVTGIATVFAMVKAGLAASLLPRQFVQGEAERSGVTLLEIGKGDLLRQPAIVTRRGQFVSEYAKYAIEWMKENL